MLHNFQGKAEVKGTDQGKTCTSCGQVQGVNANTTCPGSKITGLPKTRWDVI